MKYVVCWNDNPSIPEIGLHESNVDSEWDSRDDAEERLAKLVTQECPKTEGSLQRRFSNYRIVRVG